MTIQEFFSNYPKIAIAFSGGTDSAYLLYMAKQYAKDITAFYVSTAFQPEFEKQDAILFCKKYDIPLVMINYDLMQNSEIVNNPKNRCYYCKKTLFTQIQLAAKNAGYHVLADGTNASDDADDRPGMKALQELNVLSPLRMCNITKEQLRKDSKVHGLFTADKSAYACLATRIPHGTKITCEQLANIELIENQLKQLGFTDFRVRILPIGAKLQLKSEEFPLAVKYRKEILAIIRPFYDEILLDLKGR